MFNFSFNLLNPEILRPLALFSKQITSEDSFNNILDSLYLRRYISQLSCVPAVIKWVNTPSFVILREQHNDIIRGCVLQKPSFSHDECSPPFRRLRATMEEHMEWTLLFKASVWDVNESVVTHPVVLQRKWALIYGCKKASIMDILVKHSLI